MKFTYMIEGCHSTLTLGKLVVWSLVQAPVLQGKISSQQMFSKVEASVVGTDFQ
jgi:hypothetical protein